MKKRLFFLLITIISSCFPSKNNSSNPVDYLVSSTSVSIDPNFEPYSRTMQFRDGSLYWWNSNRQTISVIDLGNNRITKTIPIQTDGPNGIGFPLGLFVWNQDSIYIPSINFKINLINSEGTLLSHYDYNDISKLGVAVSSMARYSGMIQTDNSDRFFLLMSDLKNLNPSEINQSTLKNYPPILSFQKSKGIFDYLKFTPSSNILKYNDFIDFNISSTEKSLLLLHLKSNLLYEISFEGNKIQETVLNSNLTQAFSNDYYNSPRTSMPIDENMRLAARSAENLGLAFDPYRNLLYRFAWPGEEITDTSEIMKIDTFPPYFTLSVYDGEDFTLIQEFTLPRNTYLAHHFFVDINGLNLFPMHPKNPDFRENKLVIHTFDFSSLRNN